MYYIMNKLIESRIKMRINVNKYFYKKICERDITNVAYVTFGLLI